jgi:hypothetical protein
VPASVGDHAWDETERQHRLCAPNHTIWTPTINAGTSRSGSPAETGIRPNLTCRGRQRQSRPSIRSRSPSDRVWGPVQLHPRRALNPWRGPCKNETPEGV